MTSKYPAKHDICAKIAQLFIYPIKSCAGIELKEALLTDTGLDLDRAWMVVDESGTFVTQRELPRMVLIQPLLTTFEMIVKAPGMLALHIAIDEVEQPVMVNIWEDSVKAFDMGDVAAQWFSNFLEPHSGKKLRLVRFDPEQTRLSSMTWTEGIAAKNGFDDGFAVLVTSTASLKVLNDKLLEAGELAVTMQRFRPNIVLTGIEAYDEDRLDTLHITTQQASKTGGAQLKLVKPCPRCPIPNIDPKNGKSSPVVGDMLQTYRQNPLLDGAITLGMNAIILAGEGAVLRVGQSVGADYRFNT